MKFQFKAKIYKVGINPCVKVPFRITDKMVPEKGYIPVKGKIANHPFHQTLCPVKGQEFRLYVNGPMLTGANARVGEIHRFTLEQDLDEKSRQSPMHAALRKELAKHNLTRAFKQLTPYRQNEILKYLNSLKTEESLDRNIRKVITQLQNKEVARIP